MAWRIYTNNTDMVQSFIDANGEPVTVGIGKTVRYLVRREEEKKPKKEKEKLDGIMSEPPDDGHPVKNIYIDSKTGKMVVDYDDKLS